MNEKDPAGWQKRNTIDEPRLSELIEMYEELGFEVKTEDFDPENFPEECSECMLQYPERYKIIYTRKKTNLHQ